MTNINNSDKFPDSQTHQNPFTRHENLVQNHESTHSTHSLTPRRTTTHLRSVSSVSVIGVDGCVPDLGCLRPSLAVYASCASWMCRNHLNKTHTSQYIHIIWLCFMCVYGVYTFFYLTHTHTHCHIHTDTQKII